LRKIECLLPIIKAADARYRAGMKNFVHSMLGNPIERLGVRHWRQWGSVSLTAESVHAAIL
jgi:hypothetical protein